MHNIFSFILMILLISTILMAGCTNSTEATEADQIARAIDYVNNPTVHNFALQQVQHSSSGSYNIAQICDVWQTIYNQWTYVSDPPNFNYWTSASDSINNGLKGNCADYAVLNAAVIESIGGTSRVITACAPGGSPCHAYAEVALAKTQSDLQADANYICSRYHCEKIYYHIESDNQGDTEYWLNLDWQANYPGGMFFNDDGTFQIYYPNGLHETGTDTGYPHPEPNGDISTTTTPQPTPALSPIRTIHYNPAWHPSAPQTVQIQNNYYRYYAFEMKEGGVEKISVVTDGNPIDLMVMDSSNFNTYTNIEHTNEPGTWYSWNHLSVINDQQTLTAPTDGTYYFVLDNTRYPSNGAYAGTNVNVAVTFSSYY